MAAYDPKKFSQNDWGIVATGAVAFVVSFFPFYGVSGGGVSASVTAWHFFPSWFGVLLLVAAGAFVFLRVQGMVAMPNLPIGPKLAVLAATGLGALLIVIRVLTLDTGGGFGVHVGRKFGAWLLLIDAIVAVVFALLDFRSSGEKLPEFGGTADKPPAA